MNILKSIDLFLDHCKFEKNLSEKTILFYRIDLLQFARFLQSINIEDLDKIDKYAVKAFVQDLSKFEPRTIKRKIASSKAHLNFLEFEDYILVNPYRKVKVRIKEPQYLPTILDLEEIRKIFTFIKKGIVNAPNKESHVYGIKLRDLSVLEILFATGIRVSELCNICLANINLDSGNLLVTGKGNKERMIHICNDETLKSLREYYKFHESRINESGFFLSVG